MIQLVGDELYQWDTGRIVQIESDSPIHEVHFTTRQMDFAYVVETYNEGESTYCTIPNVILQSSQKIYCYAVKENSDGEETVSTTVFSVNKRNRPDDYVYTEPERLAFKELEQRIDDIENLESPYTTISKSKKGIITVHLHNAKSDDTVYLYTCSRRGGNKYGEWYHPDNYDSTSEDPLFLGYSTIAGKAVDPDRYPSLMFDDVPEFMPNDGKLQTEWVNHKKPLDFKQFQLDLKKWILPLLKPISRDYKWHYAEDEDLYSTLMGVNSVRKAPKLFKFCIVGENGTVYPCRNTLAVGGLVDPRLNDSMNLPDDAVITVTKDENGYPQAKRLYVSIR